MLMTISLVVMVGVKISANFLPLHLQFDMLCNIDNNGGKKKKGFGRALVR